MANGTTCASRGVHMMACGRFTGMERWKDLAVDSTVMRVISFRVTSRSSIFPVIFRKPYEEAKTKIGPDVFLCACFAYFFVSFPPSLFGHFFLSCFTFLLLRLASLMFILFSLCLCSSLWLWSFLSTFPLLLFLFLFRFF